MSLFRLYSVLMLKIQTDMASKILLLNFCAGLDGVNRVLDIIAVSERRKRFVYHEPVFYSWFNPEPSW